MTQTILKELLGDTDLNWDTPGHGGAPNTFTKTDSTGLASYSQERPSAYHVPVLDVPPVPGTGAQGSFDERLTGANKTVENCIQELAKRGLAAYSFEGWGGQSGTGRSLAECQRNTEVWSEIEAAAGSAGGVVFMPEMHYMFAQNGGLGGLYASHVLPWASAGGLILVGGGSTVLQLHAGSGVPTAFLHIAAPTSNVVLSDFTLDRNTVAGGVELDISTATADVYNDIDIIRVRTTETAPTFANTGANLCNRLRVQHSVFVGVGTMQVTGWLGALINDNNVPKGLSLKEGTTAGGSHRVTGNRLYGTGDIEVDGDKDIIITGNSLASGIIDLLSATESTVSANTLFKGSIKYRNAGVSANTVTIVDNQINATSSSEVSGIRIVSTAALDDLIVSRNKVTGAGESGIELTMSTAPMKRGQITDNTLVNNCQSGEIGNIVLASADAAAGTRDYIITRNICRQTDILKLQSSGIVETATAAPDAYDQTWIYENLIQGYNVANECVDAPECIYPTWGGADIWDAQLDGGAGAV